MSRLRSRLARIEQRAAVTHVAQRVHFLTIEGKDDEDAPIHAMIERREAMESDIFIVTRYVDPPGAAS